MSEILTPQLSDPEQRFGRGGRAARRLAAGRRSVGRRAGLIAGITLLLLLLLLSLLAPVIRPYTATQISGIPLSPPSSAHWLGTDDLGRDIFVRVCVAARVSLLISVLASLIAAVVGSAIGILAGLAQGRLPALVMALVDLLLAIPAILLALCAVTALGSSVTVLVLVLAVVGIPNFARLVRARTLELRAQEFVLSARVSGVSPPRIAVRHILSNCQSIIAVQTANTAAITILLEAALSYLGLGIQPPTPSWGSMIFESQSYMATAPWFALAPAVAILLASIGWGLIGEAFSDSQRRAF